MANCKAMHIKIYISGKYSEEHKSFMEEYVLQLCESGIHCYFMLANVFGKYRNLAKFLVRVLVLAQNLWS